MNTIIENSKLALSLCFKGVDKLSDMQAVSAMSMITDSIQLTTYKLTPAKLAMYLYDYGLRPVEGDIFGKFGMHTHLNETFELFTQLQNLLPLEEVTQTETCWVVVAQFDALALHTPTWQQAAWALAAFAEKPSTEQLMALPLDHAGIDEQQAIEMIESGRTVDGLDILLLIKTPCHGF